jgi:inosine-uridine nucleoside N-ribohydrolase
MPIAYGSSSPCDANGKPFPDDLRKIIDNLLDTTGVKENPNPNITDSAVELLRKLLTDCNEKVTILTTCPLTNIAQFIDGYPELTQKIDKICFMGGAIKVPGNIIDLDPSSNNKVAEWNVYADPKAAQIVFSSKVPVTMVPLDATNQVPMTREFYNNLSQQTEPKLHLIYLLLKVLVDKYGDPFFGEYFLWDGLAAMICVKPEIAQSYNMSIAVDLTTAQTQDDSQIPPNVSVAMTILNPNTILDQLIVTINTNSLRAQTLSKLTSIAIDSPHTAVKAGSTSPSELLVLVAKNTSSPIQKRKEVPTASNTNDETRVIDKVCN